jgi:hypothetical protein
MKRVLLLSGLVILLLLFTFCGGTGTKGSMKDPASAEAAPAQTDAIPAIRKYGVKSGIVTYEHSGFGITTKTILYFDDYGVREAEDKYDTDGTIKETNLCDGKDQYILIHKEKTAYKRGACYRGVAYKFDWEEAARGGEKYKPTKLSNQNISGKDCESFSLDISGSKTIYAGWNNICFLIETPSGNSSVVYKAVSVEENAVVPTDKLKVPSDYKIN